MSSDTAQARQRAELQNLLTQAKHLQALAEFIEQTGPPDAWLAAGCVVQSVWNLLTKRPPDFGILDYDVVYFDPDLSAETEAKWATKLQSAFPRFKLDVKNQARVHHWYPRKFGIEIPPFVSVSAAMATWPTTATATAARRQAGQWRILAPFGLDDLLSLTLRPNRSLANETVYATKAGRWQALWPELEILPWQQAIGPLALNQPVPELFERESDPRVD